MLRIINHNSFSSRLSGLLTITLIPMQFSEMFLTCWLALYLEKFFLLWLKFLQFQTERFSSKNSIQRYNSQSLVVLAIC